MPVVKSKVGLNDMNLVLSCLNIKPPSLHVMQQKLNKLTDKIEEMNKKQMIENQQYVKRIKSLAGLLNRNQSDVEYDVSYSSPPAQGCERATQSFGPLIEQPANIYRYRWKQLTNYVQRRTVITIMTTVKETTTRKSPFSHANQSY